MDTNENEKKVGLGEKLSDELLDNVTGGLLFSATPMPGHTYEAVYRCSKCFWSYTEVFTDVAPPVSLVKVHFRQSGRSCDNARINKISESEI